MLTWITGFVSRIVSKIHLSHIFIYALLKFIHVNGEYNLVIISKCSQSRYSPPSRFRVLEVLVYLIAPDFPGKVILLFLK